MDSSLFKEKIYCLFVKRLRLPLQELFGTPSCSRRDPLIGDEILRRLWRSA